MLVFQEAERLRLKKATDMYGEMYGWTKVRLCATTPALRVAAAAVEVAAAAAAAEVS